MYGPPCADITIRPSEQMLNYRKTQSGLGYNGGVKFIERRN